jgi:Domain of unknown function (DUF4190)
MRFCQADGTPLLDDAPLDPYKTMVARPEDIAAATSSRQQDDVLDLPAESDPAKTMFASEEEIRREMSARDAGDDQVIDIPPLAEPEPPRFSEPAPPPSPFSSPEGGATSGAPIPSPFEAPKPSSYEPVTPSFAEPEPMRDEPSFNPFDQPSGGAMAQSEWTPPPAPEPSWQNQQIGQNTPFQPPPGMPDGANKTLPIVSLVFGIVSLCCYISPLTGLVALITGYLGMKNANTDPANFGGKGLAIAGMITGGVFFLLGLLYWIYIIFIIGLSAMGSMGGLG